MKTLTRRLCGPVLLAAGLVLGACGGGGGSGSGGTDEGTLGDAVEPGPEAVAEEGPSADPGSEPGAGDAAEAGPGDAGGDEAAAAPDEGEDPDAAADTDAASGPDVTSDPDAAGLDAAGPDVVGTDTVDPDAAPADVPEVPACAGDCEDGDPCTVNACGPTGCTSTPASQTTVCAGAGCAGLVYHASLLCAADGQCATPLGAEDCDDGDPCTDDACSAEDGCSNEPRCGDGCGSCGAGFACTDGKCVAAEGCPEGFVRVEAGGFDMGSPEAEEVFAVYDETQHPVTLTRSYCMSTTEVTQARWQEVMGSLPSYLPVPGGEYPVSSISWFGALAYCNALSVAEGLAPCYVLEGCKGEKDTLKQCGTVTFAGLDCAGYRLPTEAEWEYAARAGTTTSTYAGDVVLATYQCQTPNPAAEDVAWYGANACTVGMDAQCAGGEACGPHPVAQKLANAWGLYDMLGNVWEWVWDEGGTYPAGPATDPLGADGLSERVVRGGSWENSAAQVRCAYRYFIAPGYGYGFNGFRVARTTK